MQQHPVVYILLILMGGIFLNSTSAHAASTIPSHTITLDHFVSTIPSSSATKTLSTLPSSSDVEDRLRIPEGSQTFTYDTQQFASEFPFQAIGIRWNGSALDNTSVQFRLEIQDAYGNHTYELKESVDMKEALPVGMHVIDPIMANQATALSFHITLTRFANQSSPSIEKIEFIYFDTSSTSSTTVPVTKNPSQKSFTAISTTDHSF
ncbi:MAG TPA: hypothetical protein VJB65_04975, partial [Patescibacteria group bacterium]|nr:hypothetical protein [Patescibacteria group bacterium]